MRFAIATALAASGLSAGSAESAITFNILQSGANVQVAMSGAFNTTGLTPAFGVVLNAAALDGSGAFVSVGAAGSSGGNYNGLSGPTSFGAGPVFFADVFGGDYVRVNGSSSSLALPTSYVSGAALSGFATYNNKTIASLGLNAGQYNYTLGQDRVTINIGAAAAVPEPASWGMMILGFGVVGATARRRRKATIAAGSLR